MYKKYGKQKKKEFEIVGEVVITQIISEQWTGTNGELNSNILGLSINGSVLRFSKTGDGWIAISSNIIVPVVVE